MADRPAEMYTAGREALQVFEPKEIFYYRVHPSTVSTDDTVDPAHVQCPDLSSNRGKFSQPYYVLYPRKEYGNHAVFKFVLEELLPTVSSPDASGGTPVVYDVRTIHDPEDDNYGHCETGIYRDTQHMRSNKIGHGAKKVFREHMSRILELERPSGVPFPP